MIYLTQMNGGKPLMVDVNTNKKRLTIYRGNGRKVKEYSYEKVFLGSGQFKAGTILVKLTGTRYLFISDEVYEFSTPEKITKFDVNIGNSNVPYSYALSKKRLFLLMEKMVMDKTEQNTFYDPYEIYYNARPKGKGKKHPFADAIKTKTVAKADGLVKRGGKKARTYTGLSSENARIVFEGKPSLAVISRRLKKLYGL